MYISLLQVVQEFILGVYDPEATAAFNQNLSDISTFKDPRSKDASQRYIPYWAISRNGFTTWYIYVVMRTSI